MTLWIKICGLSTRETVDAAVEAGADAVGFVFAPGSPRLVSPLLARELVAHVPSNVLAVGVFRGQPVDEVVDVARTVGLGAVQLHGDEAPADLAAVREAGFGTIRAVAASRWAGEAQDARGRFGEDRLLLDAPDPGAGSTFDAGVLLGAADALPAGWALAGGLTPANVAELVARLAPGGVDVSSGVESSRGVKSVALIRQFVAAARGLASAGGVASAGGPAPAGGPASAGGAAS